MYRLVSSQAASKILIKLIRPLIVFSLENSLKLQDIIDCVKRVLIEEAENTLKKQNKKINISRLSIMTGIQRIEVQKIKKSNPKEKAPKNLISKILGQWQSDLRFATKKGLPRTLTLGSEDSQFTKLVGSVSKDLNPGTILFELERVKAVKISNGKVKLLAESYVPINDYDAGFSIVANDVKDLIETAKSNIFHASEPEHLHARTEYDNISPSALANARKWLMHEGLKLHAAVRKYLSEYDCDINPNIKRNQKGARVVFSTYSFTEIDKESTDDI